MPLQAQHMNQLVTLPSAKRTPGILRHLTQLSGSLSSDADKIAYIHIYSRPSDDDKHAPLQLIRAAESGPKFVVRGHVLHQQMLMTGGYTGRVGCGELRQHG